MAPFLALSLSCLAFLPSVLAEPQLFKASCQRNNMQDNGITASICRQINKEQGFYNSWYWYPRDNECRYLNGDDPQKPAFATSPKEKENGIAGWRTFKVLCHHFGAVPVVSTSCTMEGGGC